MYLKFNFTKIKQILYRMRSTFYILIILLTVFLASCHHNRLDIDVSNIQVQPVKFERLDQELFQLTEANIQEKTKQLNQKYGSFYERYLVQILNNGGQKDSSYTEQVLQFIHDKNMHEAHQEIEKTFSEQDIQNIEQQLTEVTKRFKVFFPKRKLPKRYVTYMSGFNYGVVYADSTIGLGLEMFMGGNHPMYQMLRWPNFLTRRMSKDYIVPTIVWDWSITEFDNAEPVNNLLNHMIFYGKMLYASDALLPNIEDSIKIGYTSKQMEYCKTYEKNLWGYTIKDSKLYQNDLKVVAEFTNDGPFTGAISKECPARIGMWIGWQIVRSYMNNNENVTLEELMSETDAQKILSKSKYKP